MNRPILLIILTISLCFPSQAQTNIPKYELGIATHPGFLMAHQQSMLAMQAHTLGLELQFSKRLFSQGSWSEAYRYPQIGINALYMNLGNKRINGQVVALMPNFQFALGGTKDAHWAFRMATGLGWVSKVFDLDDNRKNLAMSSHLNGGMQLALFYNKKVREQSLIKTGVIVTHFSNASARVPNLGINMPSVYLGVSGLLQPTEPSSLKPETPVHRGLWNVYAAYANKQLDMSNPRTFNIFLLGCKRLVPTKKDERHYRFGADLFFDSQHLYNLHPKRTDYKGRVDEISEVSLTAGYQMGISRIDFFADLGLYLYRPSDFKPAFFQRLGFNCHLTNQWYTHLALKTHYATADIFEWGVGYKLGSS